MIRKIVGHMLCGLIRPSAHRSRSSESYRLLREYVPIDEN